MCGRYYMDVEVPDRKLAAIVEMMEAHYSGAYKTGEIFPGDTAPGIVEQNGKITAIPAVFGFPGMQDGKLLINARSETAAEKRSFAENLRMRRIILPATSFFEWSRDEAKTKYEFKAGSLCVIYLCGLYKIVDGDVHFVILTRPANSSMAGIHNRMPVIASEQEVRPYLTDYENAMKIISAEAPELIREPAEG